jgi:hypothetical protein
MKHTLALRRLKALAGVAMTMSGLSDRRTLKKVIYHNAKMITENFLTFGGVRLRQTLR